MSGVKHVTISDAEFYRLSQSDQQLRSIRRDVPDLIRQLRQRTTEDLQRRLGPIEQRQRAFQTSIDRLSGDVRDLERETNKRLQQQRQQFHTDLQKTAGQLRGETRQQIVHMSEKLRAETRTLIANQEQRTNQLITQERQAREAALADVRGQVGAIQADQRRKLELARTWVEAAGVLQEFIGEHYLHERFAPGQLSKLARDVRQATDNLAANAPEAALSTAQRAYQELSDLRVRLEEQEQEWQLWRSAALENTRELLAMAQQNRVCKAHDADDQPLDIDIEIDHWSNGRLTEYETQLEKLIAKIDTDDNLSTDELRAIVERQTPELEYTLTSIVRDARLAVLSSQRRVNIADHVVQSLEQEGFVLEGGTYEGADMRSSYVVKARHLDSGEVVVRVVPKPDQPEQHELELLSYDYDQVGHYEVERRIDGINDSLKAYDLSVSPPREEVGRPDPSWLNLEQIGQPRTQPQTRAQVSARSSRQST